MLDSLLIQNRELRNLQSHLAGLLYRAGIRANSATVIGGVLGVTAVVLFARGDTALGILALALSGVLDAVDGAIAREFKQATAFGGILDLTLDRVVEGRLCWDSCGRTRYCGFRPSSCCPPGTSISRPSWRLERRLIGARN
jgi:hypothetical protein